MYEQARDLLLSAALKNRSLLRVNLKKRYSLSYFGSSPRQATLYPTVALPI
jgi:hypothetical protein